MHTPNGLSATLGRMWEAATMVFFTVARIRNSSQIVVPRQQLLTIRLRHYILSFVVVLSAGCGLVRATTVSFDMDATVTRFNDPHGLTGIAVGDPLTIRLSYDLAAVDFTADPMLSDYIYNEPPLAPLLASLTFDFGTIRVTSDPARDMVVSVSPGSGGIDVLNVQPHNPGLSAGSFTVLNPYLHLVVYHLVTPTSPAIFATDALPAAPFDIGAFDFSPGSDLAGFVGQVDLDYLFHVWFQPTNMRLTPVGTVPDSGSTLLLLCAASLALHLARTCGLQVRQSQSGQSYPRSVNKSAGRQKAISCQ
jgi:hypothetical protein